MIYREDVHGYADRFSKAVILMKASIRQVAERAKVSHATVSRVLNNANVRISSETRRRVEEAAAEMGYQPNRYARALVTGRTQTIALWTTNLRSAYYADFIHYVHEEVGRHGYDLIVSSAKVSENACDDSPAVLDTIKLLSWPVDGIIAVDLTRGALPGLKNSLIGGIPFVNVGGYVLESADFVRVDLTAQAAQAVKHLASIGCKRIAYLAPNWFDWFRLVNDVRLHSYEETMAEIGQDPEFIIANDEKRESVIPALSAYVKQHGCPDGLFCYNDDMAIGALAVLRGMGIRVPEDVGLIGCDGIRETAYQCPALTTIVQPLEQICMAAWEFLKQRIQSPDSPLQQVVLMPNLEIRASTCR
jgi:DNA-binding LacI/PurR family transcriptional regulator